MFSFADVRARFHCRVANALVHLRCYGAAANAYSRALQIWLNEPGAEFQRAWCLLMVPARRAEGIAGFQRLMQRSPSADGYFLMACGLQQESRDEEAIVAFREALRLESPHAADLHYNIGVSLSRLQRWEEAADAYENATHLSPSSADAWESLGNAYAMLSRWRDAIPCFERVRRLSPTLGRGIQVAWALMEVNRLDEAEALLREALAADPVCVDTRERLAETLARLKRHDESISLARDICATDPKRASARGTLAMALLEADRPDEALAEGKAAVACSPQDGQAHYALAAVYLGMDDATAALAAIERAAACFAAEREPHHRLIVARCASIRGAALSMAGRHGEAMLAFHELLRLEPDFFERWPELAAPYELSRRETKGSS